ncbi:MAG: DUF4258 domain-containing protein [Gammaproteobacteria bacterium]
MPGEDAEQCIHAYVRNTAGYALAYTNHAKDQIKTRSIIMSDVKYILAHGRISDEPEKTKRAGYCKYKMCGQSPNSGGREICLIVIPDPDKPAIKIITVMWRDLR